MSRREKKKQRWMRSMAGLLTAALLLSEIPVMQAFAIQKEQTESSIPEEKPEEAEGSGQESSAEDGNHQETQTEMTDGTEEGEPEEVQTGSGTEESEPEEEQTGSGAEEGEPEEEQTGSSEQESTGEASETEPEEAAEPETEQAVESKIRYGLGREMTEEEIAAQKALEPEYFPEIEVFTLPESLERGISAFSMDTVSETVYEERFDSRERGILTSVKNQNPWGTCWAFSALSLMESSLISRGLATPEEIDLSERHLAYFTGHTGYDVLEHANEDTITTSPENYYLKRGGNMYYAAMRLMNWQGAAKEEEFPYSNSSTLPEDLERTSAQQSAAHLKECYMIQVEADDEASIQTIKGMIKEYGSVAWSYYHDSSYYNYSTYGYYTNQYSMTNHAIVVVGWDDTYERENFGTDEASRPSSDGAWIVRNSWGESWGEKGYFYISYEDTSLGAGNPASVIAADTADDYDNNYFYGNTAAYKGRAMRKAAQVFEISGKKTGRERVRAVSFLIASQNAAYQIQIYKNPEVSEKGVVTNPESGTPVFETMPEGTTTYAGLYTVELPESVSVAAGDRAAVVLYFPDKSRTMYTDGSNSSASETNNWQEVNTTQAGESFYASTLTGEWTDLHTENESVRMNMLTDNEDNTYTAPVVSVTAKEPANLNEKLYYSLSWNRCKNALYYEIYRSEEQDGVYTLLDKVNVATREYQDVIEPQNWKNAFFYKVRAVYEEETGLDSEAVTVAVRGSIPFPFLEVSCENEQAVLNWETMEGAAGYRIERKSTGTDFEILADITDSGITTYTDDLRDAKPDIYEYRMLAYSVEKVETEWTENAVAEHTWRILPMDFQTIRAEWIPIEGAASYTVYIGNGEKLFESVTEEETYAVCPLESCEWFETGEPCFAYVEIRNSENTVIRTFEQIPFQTVPDKLTAVAKKAEGEIKIEWGGGNGAKKVRIYRSKEGKTEEVLCTETTLEDGIFKDKDLLDSGTYQYRLVPFLINSLGMEVCGEEMVVSVVVPLQKTLSISPANIVVSKGNTVSFSLLLSPGNLHCDDPVIWTAEDENGFLTVETGVDSSVVKGRDGEDILKIVGNNFCAVGNSQNKRVILHAKQSGLEVSCQVLVNVPVTKLKLQIMEGTSGEADEPVALTVGEQMVLGVSYEPYNADDTTVTWTTSDSRVAVVEGRDLSSVLLRAVGSGCCMLYAATADGVTVSREITVEKSRILYGVWISDRNLSGLQVQKNNNGKFAAEGLEEKPVYELQTPEKSGNGVSTMQVAAYILSKDGVFSDGEEISGGTLQQADDRIVFRSANPTVAAVTKKGEIAAKTAGETEIFALDEEGNASFGSCLVKVYGESAKKQNPSDYPIDKAYKLSPVCAAFLLESYNLNPKGSCTLQVKNQYGEVLDSALFSFTCEKPSVCMVDEAGTVIPNPGFTTKKNVTVKITAALKEDKAKRKVTFKVTILPAKQADRIVLEQLTGNGEIKQITEETLAEPYRAGTTFTFRAKAYDRGGEQLEGTSFTWKLSDTSKAKVKVNSDNTVTVTIKKEGRFRLVCTAKDSRKKSTSVEIAEVTATPVISTTQVSLNKKRADAGAKKLSDSFQAEAPEGAVIEKISVVSVKTGKTALTKGNGLEAFAVVKNADESYSLSIDNSTGFVEKVKENTAYEIGLEAQISGVIGQTGTVRENFTMKLKITSKEPGVQFQTPVINRFYTDEKVLAGLLDIKAPATVTNVRVLSEEEGQSNRFDCYFTAERRNGQWYLILRDPEGDYDKNSIKGKICVSVEGYEPVIKTVTVKTPFAKQSIQQETVPSIRVNDSARTTVSLYNRTKQAALKSFRVDCVSSKELEVWEEDGALQIKVKEGAGGKEGKTLTARVWVMATEKEKDLWREPVSLTVRIKCYRTKEPSVSMEKTTLILNRQAAAEQAQTGFCLSYRNVALNPVSAWQLSSYNRQTKKYDLAGADWLSVSYDEDGGILKAGFASENLPAAGTYRFRLSKMAEGFENVSKDFTVKVVDVQPKAAVKMSGKLDLVNRQAMTLNGKITLKNAPSAAKKVTILTEDGKQENPYYAADEVVQNSFRVKLTKEGEKAALTTAKTVLPINVELENGTVVSSYLSFQPVQSIPKVIVPAAKTIQKSLENLTRDYNMKKNLQTGIKIKRIEVVSIPEGISAITKEGYVLVTLNDRGIKPGSYKIKVRIYWEGAQPVFGYPDGKPLTKTITVKVE